MILKLDCKLFRGDRPCVPNKTKGIKCGNCGYYRPIQEKILIIKLDAMGDVVRTTPILIELKKRYPESHITWITHSKSLEAIEGISCLDRIYTLSAETNTMLLAETFDLVLSLDNSHKTAALASIAKAGDKKGFGLDAKGFIVPFNKKAAVWLEMAAFDDVKKTNSRTYQDILFDICDFSFEPSLHEIILPDFSEEEEFIQEFVTKNRIKDRTIIGFNTGAGGRWPSKRWNQKGFIGLAQKVSEGLDSIPIILGGPEEVEWNRIIGISLRNKGVSFIDGGCHNPLKRFIALIQLCDIVVTGDTLAMHLAIGLKKPSVILFGPTSSDEIEIYGRGRKLIPDTDCSCYYMPYCKNEISCIDKITIEQVFSAIKKLLGI